MMDVAAHIRDYIEPTPDELRSGYNGPNLYHPVDALSDLVLEYGIMSLHGDGDDDLGAMLDRIHDAIKALANRDRTPYP